MRIKKPLKKDKDGLIIPDLSILRNSVPLDKQIVDYLVGNHVEEKAYIYHITIPYYCAVEIYEFVKRNNIDASFLFPGYDGVVKCLEEDGYVEKKKKRITGDS